MKKILGFLMVVLMFFAAAADIYAATTLGGTIDVRGRWRENNDDLNNNRGQSTAYWEEKVNLWLDAKIAEGLSGYIELQSSGSSDGFVTWGTARTRTDSAPNSMFNENRGLAFMEIRYAYIDFMIPKTPVGIKIGHFPLVLGHSIWLDTSYWGSDGFLISSSPIKELMVGLGSFKVYETLSGAGLDRADIDLYTLFANYTFMPKNTAGFNVSYLHRAGKGALGVGYDTAFYNFMLTADGALDFGLGYKFEVNLQAGTLNDYASSALTDVSAGGFALLLGATYGIGEIAEVKFNLGYGSGDKISSADKYEGYYNFNNYGYTMIYEDIVGQKIAASTLGNTSLSAASSSTDFGLYNTMYINVGAGATPMKNMSVGMDIFYLMSNEENYAGQKKNIGFEVDINFGYQIYKNLKWTFLAGYFMPGDHYDAINSADTVKTDAAWAFEQVLSLSF